jgi:hypothetical protein
VRRLALDANGNVARDTDTPYHLLPTPDLWPFLSYINYF